MKNSKNPAIRMSIIAVTTAIVAVFTIAIRIPTPVGGYVSLCDVAVTFVSYTFGPLTGLIAGGLGTAISDLLGGFDGLEALLIALIVRKNPDSLSLRILSALVAVVVVAGGYFFLTGAFLIGFGAALPEVPANIVQSAVGVLFGLPLSLAVRKAYRKIDDFAW